MADEAPQVGIIMGSQSDWETMRHAAETLGALGIAHETRIVSAHRTPDRLFAYAKEAAGHGIKAKRSKSGAISFEIQSVEDINASLQ